MQIPALTFRSSRLFASGRRPAALGLCALLLLLAGPSAVAQNANAPRQDAVTVGLPWAGAAGIQRTTAELMEEQAVAAPSLSPVWRMMRREREGPEREDLPQDPNAEAVASTAAPDAGSAASLQRPAISQTISTTFTGATLADTGAFPPDSMGAVGPTQFVVFVNGRLRTFNKTTGVADGVINLDPDVFFSAVMSPFPGGGLNFTTDPQVRYDRLTKRWILVIIDVPSSSPASIGDIPNRLLLAVSDAASNGVITGSTVWTFYFVQQDTVGGIPSNGQFLDYESLGVDANALYVGGNMFSTATSAFIECSAFVIRKSSILSGGPIVTTAFRGLAVGVGDGPFSPRGVDNYDPAATEGYIIGVSNAAFSRLNMRRISTPGATPAISADIPITVSTTSFPLTVDHLGDTGGTNGNLDALDDRLYAAHIRNGRLWTAHNIAVTNAGVGATVGAERRDAVRWYELVVPPGTGTPTVNQSGTIFDTAATVAAARQYWIPSVTVSGQGHAAVGFSTAGTPFRIDAATTGRLAGDALGTLGAISLLSASATAYNPPADPGGAGGRRWGDYSFVSLDPNDDMTMWTIQEFNDATNSYGVRVVKLLAPPPATPASSSSVPAGYSSIIVPMTGTSVSGSGFFDPGPGFSNRLSASVTGGVTVNSVTFTDATHVVLDISTVGASAGAKNVTITNPDGQSVTANSLITVVAPAQVLSVTANRAFPVAPGTSITWTVNASGGTAPLQYQFYRQNVNTGIWTLPQPWSASNTFTWATTPADQGTYLLQVQVRSAGSTGDAEAFQNTAPFGIDGTFPVNVVSLIANQIFPMAAGTTITWTAQASGGSAPLQYQFYRYDVTTATWSIVQPYSSSNTFTSTPGAAQAGPQKIQVWVKSTGAPAALEASRDSRLFTVTTAILTVSAVSISGPLQTGSPITFTALARGGVQPTSYRFYLYNTGTATWTLLQNWSSSRSVVRTFTSPGSFLVQAQGRNPGSTDADSFVNTDPFTVAAGPVTVTSLTADRGFPSAVGTVIRWTATATGGNAPLLYKFWRYSVGAGAWTMVQDYSASPIYSWNTTGALQGTYLIQVWVKGTGSSADVEGSLNSIYFGVDNTFPLEALPIEISPPLPDVGLGTTFRGKARGGNVPLEYRWWFYNGSSWTPLSSYALDPGTVISGLSPGTTYQLQLWVRRTGSSADWEAFSSTGTIVVQEPTVTTTLTGNYSDSLPAGTPLTVRASSTPAAGYEYKFYRYSSVTSSWTLVQDWSATDTYSQTLPSAPGDYIIQEYTRRAGSLVDAAIAYANFYYTITP